MLIPPPTGVTTPGIPICPLIALLPTPGPTTTPPLSIIVLGRRATTPFPILQTTARGLEQVLQGLSIPPFKNSPCPHLRRCLQTFRPRHRLRTKILPRRQTRTRRTPLSLVQLRRGQGGGMTRLSVSIIARGQSAPSPTAPSITLTFMLWRKNMAQGGCLLVSTDLRFDLISTPVKFRSYRSRTFPEFKELRKQWRKAKKEGSLSSPQSTATNPIVESRRRHSSLPGIASYRTSNTYFQPGVGSQAWADRDQVRRCYMSMAYPSEAGVVDDAYDRYDTSWLSANNHQITGYTQCTTQDLYTTTTHGYTYPERLSVGVDGGPRDSISLRLTSSPDNSEKL